MLRSFTIEGKGLHTGKPSSVTISPVKKGSGVTFMTENGPIPACVANIDPLSQRGTNLYCEQAEIRTVEHILAALCFFEHDVQVQIRGEEIPALDGSAAPWTKALEAAGAMPNARFYSLPHPIRVRDGESYAQLDPIPANETAEYEVVLDFNLSAIGPQSYRFSPQKDRFAKTVAPARTFALESEVKEILAAGLGVGADLNTSLILGKTGPLNPDGKRFVDEPARHKMLDALGDLYLVGGLPHAKMKLFRPGHHLMHAVVNEIVKIVS